MSDVISIPEPDELTAPFWAAAAEGRFIFHRCTECRNAFHLWRGACPRCRSTRLAVEDACLDGTVYSYTIVRRSRAEGWADLVPYAVVLVDLDDGPRFLTRYLADDVDTVRVGLRVRLRMEPVDDQIAIPFAVAPEEPS